MHSVKTKSEAGFLVFVVFVLGVLLGGVGNHLWNARVSSNSQPGPRPGGRGGPGQFAQRLGLTPDQQKQIGTIVDDMHAQLQALYAPVDAKGDDVRMQTRAKIRAVLTPDQQTKFDAMMKERDAHRPSGPGPHFGSGGPPPGQVPPGAAIPVPHSGEQH